MAGTTIKGSQVARSLTDWQKEALVDAFAESGNVSQAARQIGVDYKVAYPWIRANMEHVLEIRKAKQITILEQIKYVRRLVLEELADPARLKKASNHDLALLFGIFTDKINVIEGSPTSHVRVEHSAAVVLSPEEREKARELRAKLLEEGMRPPVHRTESQIIDAESKVTK